MWTKFSNKYYPTLTTDEYDYVYFECNEPCAKMFIEHLFDDNNNYEISNYVNYPEPTILNVSEYIGNYYDGSYFRVRVITMTELQELGLATKELFPKNLLFNNPTYRQGTQYRFNLIHSHMKR